MVPPGEPPGAFRATAPRSSLLLSSTAGCEQAAAELGEEVQEAVSRFPDHSGKCTPEEESAWREAPVFTTPVEERADARL